MSEEHPGKVYLVGAGPGDPGLLTLRGKECLERADVVVYDALVNPAVLAYAPRAEHIYAGKKSDRHSLPQDEINHLLIALARKHAAVVRLKGGDPFIFGRGGEEALALAGAGVPFEVVPGITAAVGAAAYAGIPLTHRGLASSVTFLTGHSGRADGAPDLGEVSGTGSLVFYMGVKNLPHLVAALINGGRPASTPAAVIEWGTFARQRTVTGTLNDIAARCAAAHVGAPAVFVVGEVVALRARMSWFEARPLFGVRVAVTHTAQRSGLLESRLRELGADVLAFPTLEITPAVPDVLPSDLSTFHWMVLTSVNAANMVFEHLDRSGQDARALAGVKLCAVGATTLDALRRRFLLADAHPEGYSPETLLESLRAQGPLEGQRILLPRSDIARSTLPQVLRAAGADVTEVAAYEKRTPPRSEENLQRLLSFAPHLVVFTNAEAARSFARLLGPTHLQRLSETSAFASIGPVTSQAAREQGLTIAVEPGQHEVEQLIEEICAWHST